jgi:hypothetical protein
VTVRRKLLDVVERRAFENPQDFAVFVPPEIAPAFTTADLAEALEMPRWLAQKMAYCPREMGTTVHKDALICILVSNGYPLPWRSLDPEPPRVLPPLNRLGTNRVGTKIWQI